MAILNDQTGLVPMGQNGRTFEWGAAAYSTTDATVEVPTKLAQIECVAVFPANTVATDESLTVDETVNSDGRITVPTDTQSITIKRTGASKTSGLKFFYLLIGH